MYEKWHLADLVILNIRNIGICNISTVKRDWETADGSDDWPRESRLLSFRRWRQGQRHDRSWGIPRSSSERRWQKLRRQESAVLHSEMPARQQPATKAAASFVFWFRAYQRSRSMLKRCTASARRYPTPGRCVVTYAEIYGLWSSREEFYVRCLNKFSVSW